jgi:hypothetical protein
MTFLSQTIGVSKKRETKLTYQWAKVCVKLKYSSKSSEPGEKGGYQSVMVGGQVDG